MNIKNVFSHGQHKLVGIMSLTQGELRDIETEKLVDGFYKVSYITPDNVDNSRDWHTVVTGKKLAQIMSAAFEE